MSQDRRESVDRSPVRPGADAPAPATVGAAMLAVVALFLLMTNVRIDRSDFRAFYDSGAAWRSGAPYPELPSPDLNPPTLAVAMSPLTFLPLPAAFWIWTGIGTVAVAATCAAAFRRTHTPPARRLRVIALLAISMPAVAAWLLGQLTWMLMLLVTRAWLARTPLRAGAWLGTAVAINPPLALMAVFLPWRITAATALVALAITVMTVGITGWPAWDAWMRLGGDITWLGWTMNGSLWGWSVRLQQLSTIPQMSLWDLPWPWWLTIGAAAALIALFVRRADSDRRWTLALFASLLLAPLGWVYYLPLAVGPMLGSWRPNAWAVVGTVLFLIPVPLIAPLVRNAAAVILVNSIYAAGFVCWVIAWSRPAPARTSGTR